MGFFFVSFVSSWGKVRRGASAITAWLERRFLMGDTFRAMVG
jgi:hypothetical protein